MISASLEYRAQSISVGGRSVITYVTCLITTQTRFVYSLYPFSFLIEQLIPVKEESKNSFVSILLIIDNTLIPCTCQRPLHGGITILQA